MEEAECSNTGADSGPGCSQQHDNSEMDADLLPLPAETEHRVSELFPRNLVSLFASTPALMLKWPQAGKAEVTRSMAIAGSQLNGELDLQRMQVVVRIRPPMAKGLPRWSKENCIHALSSCSVAIAPPESSQGYKNGDRGQTYTFSRVFGADTSQQDYFEATAAPMVRQLVRKKQQASVMMAYGISAAGKTYTIEGTKNEQGVVPRALELLFQELAACQEPLRVCVQNYEVYNESIYDLLDAEGLGPQGQRPVLRLKEDPQGRIFVAGLSEVEVDNPEAAMEQLRRGSRQRQRAATTLNYSSSRSHSIFVVCLCRKNGASAADAGTNAEGSVGGGKLGQISFVDLAGSERAARTGNVGVRLKESVAINSSLMTLGRCLEALRWNQQHRLAEPRLVPFRESKVTYLFRDVLHGWGQILLSVNVSPNAKDYDETTHVLKYAALAAQIGTAARLEAPARALKAVSPNITKKRAAPPSKPVPAGKDATVHKAEEKAALAETEIREEVSNEMGELLREMEANYKERLASETLILEQKFKRQARQGGSKPADSDPMPAAAAEAAAQSSKAELDAALARIAALEAELQGGAKPAGELQAAEARAADAQAQLRDGLQRRISEEITQINANKSMEAEMLEQQLERARKDNLALQRRLEAALGLAAGPGPARKQGEVGGPATMQAVLPSYGIAPACDYRAAALTARRLKA
ncbi:hypothetical protein WJX72_000545 [[Myrmecia] bisecta]|uniref:Kinesin-like protein n=1 Tax=[Myrmecia] bisecta TaxID=41462 RepID=A0AAW1PBP3_9CHLO